MIQGSFILFTITVTTIITFTNDIQSSYRKIFSLHSLYQDEVLSPSLINNVKRNVREEVVQLSHPC